MSDEQKSAATPLLIASAIAIAVVGGVFYLRSAPVAVAPQPDPAPEVATVVAPPAVAPPAIAPEVQSDAPDTLPEVADFIAPSFDTFRVESDGSMVIAGRAEPGQEVDVLLGGAAIERVTADPSGAFVAFPQAGPSDQPRRLSLLGDPQGAALPSATSFIVAPIAPPDVLAAAPEETDQTAAAAETALAAPEIPVAPEVDLAEIVPKASPTVLQTDADGVRVVQGGPALDAPEVADNVALDAITYDPTGEVQLSGRATGDGAVQVYIDNAPLTASPVTEGGDWRIELPQIDTGVYTLRIDEVDTEGEVVSRLETPFKREEPANVAAVLAEETSAEGFEVAVRTVQPGMTLWAIAEENLGDGILYVEVFEANSDLIRDPDLIYPGQIFRIPEVSQ